MIQIMDFSAQNPRSSNALSLAARNNDVKSVRRLISKINPNCVDNRGWTCLHEAAFNDSYEALKLILKNRRCRPLVESHEGHTVLYVACQNHYSTRCIEYLLENVDNIANYGSREGFTPLHLASRQGRDDVVQMLIDHGAIIDVVDFDGDSPLHEACQGGQHETVNILLHAGASPEIKNESRVTPLHMACATGSLKSVQYLLPFTSDINVIDCHGDTPLIACTRGENEELVEFLLQNGADPNISNYTFKQAIDFALENGLVKAFKLLFEATDVDELNINLVYRALSPSYLNIDIVEMLFQSDLDAEFFMYNECWLLETWLEDTHHQLTHSSVVPDYKEFAPLSTYLNVSEYIYTLSPDKFRECFYLALMKGLSTNAEHCDEMPPLVWLHYCPHSACFEEAIKLLVLHDCDVDYCSTMYTIDNKSSKRFSLTKQQRGDMSDEASYFPDAFIVSLMLQPTTLHLMIPYSLHCDPGYLLKFANDIGAIERVPTSTQAALIRMVDSDCELTSYDVFKYHVPPLKHWSRLKVRNIIKSNHRFTNTTQQFLNILNKLPIPNSMKKYIRFL